MQKLLPACPKRLWIASLLIASTVPLRLVHSQELLRNGDFEAGRLVPWNVTQTGPLVALTAENSPFTNVYPAGVSSVRLKDEDKDLDQPSLTQGFAGQPAITFGFDFRVPPADSPFGWAVAWDGDAATTGFFFSLGGADGNSIELNYQKVIALKDAWYHVSGWADAPHQTVKGTITNTLGESASFEGGFPFGVQGELNAVLITDGNPDRSADILLDNFYTRAIRIESSLNGQGQQVLTWLVPEFTLQTATSFDANTQWTDVPATGGVYTNTFSDPKRFFRLKH